MTDNRSTTIQVRVKPQLRDLIKADAAERELTESQIVRSILAAYYKARK